jgi:hypothetical protein
MKTSMLLLWEKSIILMQLKENHMKLFLTLN